MHKAIAERRFQYKMHKAIAESYNVQTTRTTYHGTTPAASALITATGFKGAACERALYGRGVYSAPDIWVALGHAPPFEYSRQIVFVVEFLEGPSAPGTKDQVDFGFNGYGKEILTLTNPEQTILCASKENQLLATYRIKVRYMSERPFTQKNKDCIKVVHSDICKIIKEFRSMKYANHDTYQNGDAVLVKGAIKAYAEFTNMSGVIKRIVQGHNYFFCVLLDCPVQRQAVQRINSLHVNKVRFPFLKQDESELLCFKVGHIQKHKNNHAAAASDATLLGKRKADANGA